MIYRAVNVTRAAVPLMREQRSGCILRRNLRQPPKQEAIPRVIEPQDLVGVVSSLCSSDSAFVTAQAIFADGGQVRA